MENNIIKCLILFYLTLLYPIFFMFIVCDIEFPGLFGSKAGEYIATGIYMIGFLPSLAILFIGIRTNKMINSVKTKWVFWIIIITSSFIGIMLNLCITGFMHYLLDN